MDWLEDELKRALAPKEPPPDFDRRVRHRMVRTFPRWLAAAAAVLLLAGTGEAYRWHRGQVARQQVMLAMRIAGGKLRLVQVHFQGDLR